MLELIKYTIEQDHHQEGWLCFPVKAGDEVTLIYNTSNKRYYKFGYLHPGAAERVKYNLTHPDTRFEFTEDRGDYNERYVPQKGHVIISSIIPDEVTV